MTSPLAVGCKPAVVQLSPLAQKLTDSSNLPQGSTTSVDPRVDRDIFNRAKAKTRGPVITNVDALRDPAAQAALVELGFKDTHSDQVTAYEKRENGVVQRVSWDAQDTVALVIETADNASLKARGRDKEAIVSFTARDGKPAAISNQVLVTGNGQ